MVEGGLPEENCLNISLDLDWDFDLEWEELLEWEEVLEWLEWLELDLVKEIELIDVMEVSLDLIIGGVLGGDPEGYKVEWYKAGIIFVPAKNTVIL